MVKKYYVIEEDSLALPRPYADTSILAGVFCSAILSTKWLPFSFIAGVFMAAFAIIKVVQQNTLKEIPLRTKEEIKKCL